jgi:hypothetical protein
MVLQSFKQIVENKAYQIEENDRKIFEQGDFQSFFGLNPTNDFIEFIIYDANNNELPQDSAQGAYVRYLPLNNQTINNYFIVKTGTIMQKNKLPAEYFIDAERLIKEAGYNNGIFKTQITLLSKRVGSYSPDDKLWIKEISPSRTEVKLLPLAAGVEKNAQLKERYNIFVNEGNFRDDTAPFINQFLEKITAKEIDTFIKSKYGNAFYNELVKEYGISSFTNLALNIENKFREATTYEFSNKYSDIGDGKTYGLLKPIPQPISLSVKEITDTCYKILVQIINSILPTPKVKEVSTFDAGFLESLDPVSTALSRRQSDTVFNTNNPALKTIEMVKVTETAFSIRESGTGEPTGGGTGGGRTKTYGRFKITRKAIPATFEQSLITYIDVNGDEQKIQTATYGYIGEYCIERGSIKGVVQLYEIEASGICLPAGESGGGSGQGGGNTGGGNTGGGGRGGGTGRGSGPGGDGPEERPDRRNER